MTNFNFRVIGTGNAWPVLIGSEHPYYDRKNCNDLTNAAFSLFESNQNDEIIWEVIIDAGFGTPQFLLHNHNRIPEAIVLTHPHLDHIAGIDWIVQSHYRIDKKHPFPVYCSALCWDSLINILPHLDGLMEHHELIPSVTVRIKEANELNVTAFPVYHGPNIQGAMLLLFELENYPDKKIIFTGDILCPLLRKTDYTHLKKAKYLVTDANNRWPYPNSNHWSILPEHNQTQFDFLSEWKSKIRIANLIKPHTNNKTDQLTINYLDEFISEQYQSFNLPLNVIDFAERVAPDQIVLVHYSGLEDKKYHNEKILTRSELLEWSNAQKPGILKFLTPPGGSFFHI